MFVEQPGGHNEFQQAFCRPQAVLHDPVIQGLTNILSLKSPILLLTVMALNKRVVTGSTTSVRTVVIPLITVGWAITVETLWFSR